MIRKLLIEPDRRRKLPQSFSWVDQRLVRCGIISIIDDPARALYLFLVTVADAEGLSYYSQDRICTIMGWSIPTLTAARLTLIQAGLVAYRYPLYQVLDLQRPLQLSQTRSTPQSHMTRQPSPLAQQEHGRKNSTQSIAEILQKITRTHPFNEEISQ